MKTRPSKLAATRPARRKPNARPASLTAKLVRIGNSRGVRLPKAVIEQAGLTDDVVMFVRDGQVVIQSASPATKVARAGWEEQITAALAEHGDDIAEFRDWQNISNDFDEKEWTW